MPFFGQAALKTPNISTFGFTGFSCYMPRVCGCIAPFGDFTVVDASQAHEDRYGNEEWMPPEVVVVWGNEPLASNADGYVGHWLVPVSYTHLGGWAPGRCRCCPGRSGPPRPRLS